MWTGKVAVGICLCQSISRLHDIHSEHIEYTMVTHKNTFSYPNLTY
jgi:hypothetical protein